MDYLSEILTGMKKAALVTTKRGEKVNCMTVAWGQVGIEWNTLIFTALIRGSRYTHEMLEASGEFSLNVPHGVSAGKVGKIMAYCGTKSGRDVNKVEELKLNLIPGDNIDAPGILEVPLTLECKVIYKQDQDPTAIPQVHLDRFYPEGDAGKYHSTGRDIHTMYYGEVVGAYIVEV